VQKARDALLARRTAAELGAFALLKLVVSVVVLATGYEGVSDGLRARRVAQTFAHAPALTRGPAGYTAVLAAAA
jgi:hypothetical protein